MTSFSAHLERCALLLLVLSSFCAQSQVEHDFFYFVGCFYNGTTEILYMLDGEDILYVDFDQKAIVYNLPTFTAFDPSTVLDAQHVYKNAKKGSRTCLALMSYITKGEIHPPETRDPPESALYSAEEVQQGVENKLICFVNHFFPPFLKITWTKNNQPVTEGVWTDQYIPNDDYTFHILSTLTFTPWDGDIYSCTVEHAALESPKTTIWEPDFIHSGLGIDIFCGVGLSFGLVGVATGVFLIVKALQEN